MSRKSRKSRKKHDAHQDAASSDASSGHDVSSGGHSGSGGKSDGSSGSGGKSDGSSGSGGKSGGKSSGSGGKSDGSSGSGGKSSGSSGSGGKSDGSSGSGGKSGGKSSGSGGKSDGSGGKSDGSSGSGGKSDGSSGSGGKSDGSSGSGGKSDGSSGSGGKSDGSSGSGGKSDGSSGSGGKSDGSSGSGGKSDGSSGSGGKSDGSSGSGGKSDGSSGSGGKSGGSSGSGGKSGGSSGASSGGDSGGSDGGDDPLCIDENKSFVTDLDLKVSCGADGADACAIRHENGYDKPVALTLNLAGALTDAIVSTQDDKKVNAVSTGAVDSDSTVFIRVSRSDDSGNADGNNIFFSGDVDLGGSFTALAANAGRDFGGQTFVHIFDQDGGELLQTIEFHTSCSQPLVIGEQYGSVSLGGFAFDDNGVSVVFEGGPVLAEPDIIYSIDGGADADLFTVDPDTGEVSFIAPPDFENPLDEGADNVYEVVVKATAKSDPDCFVKEPLRIQVKDVEEPVAGGLSGTYFCDADQDDVDDGHANGDLDIAGKTVTLLAADGVTPATDIDGAAVAAVLTDAEGNYRFDNLAAGDYVVMFENSLAEGKTFIAPNQGDDTIDSDVVDLVNGKTAPVTVMAGEETRDVDVGVEELNDDPELMPEIVNLCADEMIVVDVLANDSDPNGDMLTITHVGGMAIAEGGTVTLASGAEVTLTGGELKYDLTGDDSFDTLLVGDMAIDMFSYTASDGNGGSADSTVGVKVWGALNTLDTIAEDIDGTAGTLLIQRIVTPLEYEFPVTVASGDARIDGTYDDALAYCVEKAQPFPLDTAVEGTYYVSDPDNPVLADVVGNEENLDLVNWILNQQFETLDAGTLDDGDLGTPGATGANYLHLEVQDAIWFLTDDAAVPNPGSARAENTQEIIDAALAMGEGFEAGAGDLVGLVFEPTDANLQSYIVGVPFDDLAQDCVCV